MNPKRRGLEQAFYTSWGFGAWWTCLGWFSLWASYVCSEVAAEVGVPAGFLIHVSGPWMHIAIGSCYHYSWEKVSNKTGLSHFSPWKFGSSRTKGQEFCVRIGESFWDPWVAQRFGACLWPRARSWRPGIESHIGLPVHGACFSICLCLCLSLSLCDYLK